ncbi:protein of unknown function [Methylocella tundrae]|uniref:Uncharacterized protein n=1 Tax=Methylocella tundrae TaxID=227605 RepID=A0A4U8Z5C1_METTU|nr:protein of unknown function [Methylocella tundrae]
MIRLALSDRSVRTRPRLDLARPPHVFAVPNLASFAQFAIAFWANPESLPAEERATLVTAATPRGQKQKKEVRPRAGPLTALEADSNGRDFGKLPRWRCGEAFLQNSLCPGSDRDRARRSVRMAPARICDQRLGQGARRRLRQADQNAHRADHLLHGRLRHRAYIGCAKSRQGRRQGSRLF